MTGDHRFVGGHHRFARFDRRQDQRASRFDPSDHLHHDVHARILDHGLRICGELFGRQIDRSGPLQITHGHTDQLKISDQRMTFLRGQQD